MPMEKIRKILLENKFEEDRGNFSKEFNGIPVRAYFDREKNELVLTAPKETPERWQSLNEAKKELAELFEEITIVAK